MIRLERAALAAALTAFLAFPVYLLSRSGGAPDGVTGGPFPGERSCARAGCHTGGGPNTGAGGVAITIDGAEPGPDFRFESGRTYQLGVTVSDPAAMRWGFQLTARAEDDGCEQAGALESAEQAVSVDPDRNPGDCTGIDLANHTSPKSGGTSATFMVNWTPGDSDDGNVIIAAAGNAANGNGVPSGDMIYTTSLTVQPAEIVDPGPTPMISEGGTVLANLLPTLSSVTARSIVTVFGQDFVPEGTAVLDAELTPEGEVSTVLADTCLEIDGKRSPMFAVFPTQLNAQAPDDLGMGPVSVEVIRGCGTPDEVRSNTGSVDVAAVAPGFFVFNFNDADGANPIAALHAGGPDVVFADDSLADSTRRSFPAVPGQFVSLFMTGLGETSPSFAAGQIPQTVNPGDPLAELPEGTSVSITIGGLPVPPEGVLYVGVAPCCAGLYQVVVQVPPSAPDGDHEVVVTVNGVSTPPGPFISVAAAAAGGALGSAPSQTPTASDQDQIGPETDPY